MKGKLDIKTLKACTRKFTKWKTRARNCRYLSGKDYKVIFAVHFFAF